VGPVATARGAGRCRAETKARPFRLDVHRPAPRHKRASGACSLRASALMEAVARARRRCQSQCGDERHRPPNRALLISPKSARADPRRWSRTAEGTPGAGCCFQSGRPTGALVQTRGRGRLDRRRETIAMHGSDHVRALDHVAACGANRSPWPALSQRGSHPNCPRQERRPARWRLAMCFESPVTLSRKTSSRMIDRPSSYNPPSSADAEV
jgi:hypothetical protein